MSGAGPAIDYPRPTGLNRRRHRLFVRLQHARDRRRQVKAGMSSFPEAWRRHVVEAPRPVRRAPRTVWMLWLQGEHRAPPLVRAACESWRRLNAGWRVVVLHRDTIGRHIDLPSFPDGTRRNHMANVVRLRLLERYGGVWADATTICLRPLDDWIDRVLPTGFFAFARPQPVRALANWFIAAEAESPAVEAWRVWSEAYLLRGRKPASYFWSHHTFNWLLRRSPGLRRLWADTPQIPARGPHVLQRLLDGDLDASSRPTSDQMAMLPLVKMNWKKGYTLDAIRQELAAHGVPWTGGGD